MSKYFTLFAAAAAVSSVLWGHTAHAASVTIDTVERLSPQALAIAQRDEFLRQVGIVFSGVVTNCPRGSEVSISERCQDAPGAVVNDTWDRNAPAADTSQYDACTGSDTQPSYCESIVGQTVVRFVTSYDDIITATAQTDAYFRDKATPISLSALERAEEANAAVAARALEVGVTGAVGGVGTGTESA